MVTKPDNFILESAMDAVNVAYSMGYRPCGNCGTWLLPKQMTEGSRDPETGQQMYFCCVCVGEVNHLLEGK